MKRRFSLYRLWILFFFIAAGTIFEESFFIVGENNQGVVRSWGKPAGEIVTRPGLYFKEPVIQDVVYIEKRMQRLEKDLNDVVTSDHKGLEVTIVAYWCVNDPLKFVSSGGEAAFRNHLMELVDLTVRRNLMGVDLAHVLKADWFRPVSSDLSMAVQKYGITIVDAQLKNIDYAPDERPKVYAQMLSERTRLTAGLRAETLQKKTEIEAQASRETAEIENEASLKAQELLAQADREVIQIIDAVYKKDPKLYTFFKTLEIYKVTVNDKTTLLLSAQTSTSLPTTMNLKEFVKDKP